MLAQHFPGKKQGFKKKHLLRLMEFGSGGGGKGSRGEKNDDGMEI